MLQLVINKLSQKTTKTTRQRKDTECTKKSVFSKERNGQIQEADLRDNTCGISQGHTLEKILKVCH